jgi:hypothetical protein
MTRRIAFRAEHRSIGIGFTGETIVVTCWRVPEPHIAPGRLTRLRLHDPENNHVEYAGD